MANSDKNIRIQPNRNSTLFPKITFTGQSNNPITLNVLDDNSLSFEGSSGQLFAINNNLSSGYIFSVNDISGLPSFRINADGTVGIAEYYGNVGIGVTNPLYKFHARGDSYFSSTGNTALLLISGTGGTIIASNSVNVTLTDPARKALVINAATSQTANLLEWYADGGVGGGYSQAGRIRPSGHLVLGASGNITMSNGTSAILALQGRGSTEGLAIRGFNSIASEPLFEVQGNAGNQLFGIYGDGGVNAPRINITGTTASTSTSTGALIVSGGVGIGGSVHIGRQLTVTQTTRLNSSIFNNPPTSSIGASLIQSGYGSFGSYWTGYQVENGYLIYGRQVSGGFINIEEPLTGALVGGTSNVFAEALQHFKWGNDKYVVLASTGNSVLYSTSPVGAGSSWYYATLPTSASWQKLEYGNNRFIAIATGSTSAYSLDGINWTLSTLPGSYTWSDIKHGNGVFVAGAGNTVAYTYDGIEWTIASNNVNSTFITFGNGLFFANSTSNTASYSRDGITWTNTTLPSDTHRASGYGNGVFINVGNSTTSYFSYDLINWISGPGGTEGGSIPAPWYVNNLFYFKLNDGYSKVVTGPTGTLDFSPRFTGDLNNVRIGAVTPGAAEFTSLAAVGPVRFVSGVASTNYKSGSVVITGGVGIGGTLNVNNIGIGYTGIPYNPSISFIGTTGDPIRLSVLSNNTLSFEGSSGQLFSINNNLSSGWIFSVNDISGIPLFRANANANIAMAEYAGNVGIGLSNATFKLQVAGSASIGDTLVANNLQINSNLNYYPATGTTGGISWSTISLPAGVSGITKMIYANNKFVGVGNTFAVYSTDGITWSSVNFTGFPSSENFNNLAYGNGIYLTLAGTSSTVGLYSTDAITWTRTFLPTSRIVFRGLAYGNGCFVGYDQSGNIIRSTNGISWSTVATIGGYGREIKFLNGLFFGSFWSGSTAPDNTWTSPDGINWTFLNIPYPNQYGITYGNGRYVASTGTTSVYSTDLVNWVEAVRPDSFTTLYTPSYHNGTFYIPNNFGTLYYSKDLLSWGSYNGLNINELVYGADKLVIPNGTSVFVSQSAQGKADISPFLNSSIENTRIGAKSPDSATFTHLSALNNVNITSPLNSTSVNNGALRVVGGVGIGGTTNLNTLRVNQDFVFTPAIGTTAIASGLSTATLPSIPGASGNIRLRAVTFGNGRFVGGASTSIIWSDDAINWNRVNTPFTSGTYIQAIAYGNGTWIASTTTSTELIYSINNGVTWNLTTIPNANVTDAVYGNGIFIIGSGSYTGISTNGINWTTYTPAHYPHSFINGYFYSNTERSADGYNWQALNIPVSNAKISYGNGLYFAAEYNSANYYISYDGVNFTTTTIGNAVHVNSAYYNGVYYLLTQHNNQILKYSTDGFNYTNVVYPNGSTNYGIAAGNNKIVLFNTLYTDITNYIYYAEASFGKANIQPFREGTIDNVTIGSRIPQAGTFNNVSVLKNLNVNSSFPSVSSNTGALTVFGGAGVGQTLNVGGSVNVSNSFNLVNTTTGIATTWTRTVVGTGATITYLAYANNLYVGVGYSSLTSTDGVSWTTRTLPNNLSFVSYGNGIWSGLLFNSALGATSTNGTTWTSYAMSNSRQWTMMAYGNGVFVTIARATNIAAYSTNGYNWTEVTLPTTGSPVWVWLTYGGGYFVAVANGSTTAVYSSDGINWSTTTLPSAGGWNCVTYGNGYFYVTGSSTGGVYSRDLVNWTTYSHTISGTAYVAYNNGSFVVADVNGATRTNIITGDFTSRTQIDLPGPQIPTALVAGDRNFIAGYGQTLYTFPIPNNSISVFPNTTGEINNVEIGSVKPASGAFSNIYAQNTAVIGSTVRSTSPYTGALTVVGGVGIGQSLNVGSDVIINGGRESNSTSTGSLIVRGGVGITGGLYVSPFSSTTKGLVVTSRSSQSGNLFELQNSSLSTITSFNYLGDLNITSSTANTSTTTGSIVTAGGVGIGGSVSIGSTSVSTSTTNGALKVSGGVGIGGNVNVGGSLNFSTSTFGGVSTTITPTMTFIGQANDPITLSVLADNSLSFDGSSGQLFSINNNLSTGWIFSISDISGLPLFRTNADGTVSMGEFGGNVGIGLTNPSYKLQVAGNAGIANTLFVSGNAHFGSTSYYDSYAVYNAPIITATENFAGDSGIQIQNKSNDLNARSGINIYNDSSTDYFNIMLGSSNYGGIGQSMAFIETNKPLDVSFASGMTVRDGIGNALTITGTAVTVSPTTESTSSTNGSLIVTGGAGIGKSLNVAGYLSSKPAYATAGLASDQTIASNSDILVLFTDNADPNGWWIGTAAIGSSHRFKPNIAGLYFVSAQAHFKQTTGTGQMNLQARKNNNTFAIAMDNLITDSSGRTLNLTGVVSLDGNTDYIDFTAYSNSSGSHQITGEAARSYSQVTIYKIF